MGLVIKRNSKGQYNMKSSISNEQIHDEKWISEKEAIKVLILRKWFDFVESSIRTYIEFPDGYQVNGKFKFGDKNGNGSEWLLKKNWNSIDEKFREICKELDINFNEVNFNEEE